MLVEYLQRPNSKCEHSKVASNAWNGKFSNYREYNNSGGQRLFSAIKHYNSFLLNDVVEKCSYK